MRRARLSAVCLVLAACTGGATSLAPPPSTPRVTDPAATEFCNRLIGMLPQLAGILNATTTDFAGLARLYAGVVPAAPPVIKPTVQDIVDALTEASDPARLGDFDQRATVDTQKLTDYTRANC